MLRINQDESVLDHATRRDLLGCGFWVAAKTDCRLRMAGKALGAMKDEVRGIARRKRGRNLSIAAGNLNGQLPDRKEYFKPAETRSCGVERHPASSPARRPTGFWPEERTVSCRSSPWRCGYRTERVRKRSETLGRPTQVLRWDEWRPRPARSSRANPRSAGRSCLTGSSRRAYFASVIQTARGPGSGDGGRHGGPPAATRAESGFLVVR